jgi:DUF1009 family protein
MQPKLGILAGGGELPARLVAACRAEGRDMFVLALTGHAERRLIPADVPQAWIRLGEAGRGFDILREMKIEDVVFAGAVKRPSLFELKPDGRTAAFFARLGLRALGDDGLLKAVVTEFEREGFRVVGAESVMTGLLAPQGVWGQHLPDPQGEADINRAIEVARGLGALDVGQAVIVQQGIVLGVEAIEGTDALIRRCGQLRRPGPGGVLVKMSKPGQERRVDLPTIGTDTVQLAAASGLAGIAVEAGAALVLDRAAVITEADRQGLFVCGFGARE